MYVNHYNISKFKCDYDNLSISLILSSIGILAVKQEIRFLENNIRLLRIKMSIVKNTSFTMLIFIH